VSTNIAKNYLFKLREDTKRQYHFLH